MKLERGVKVSNLRAEDGALIVDMTVTRWWVAREVVRRIPVAVMFRHPLAVAWALLRIWTPSKPSGRSRPA